MHWDFTPYVLPVAASAVICAWLAYIAWHRRPAPGATAFCLLMLAVAEWALAYALELVSPDLPTTLFWDNIGWLGSVGAPTLWLAFALQYTGRARWLSRPIVTILFVEPLVTLLLVWTNPFHHLIEYNFSLDRKVPFSALVMDYGVWYWVNIVYSYLLLLFGTLLIFALIQTLFRSARLYRWQAGALLIAVITPWVGNILIITDLSPFPRHLDLTPFTFTITGMAFGWSLWRYRLLDIVPVAREQVIESMSDAVIVVDDQKRIVDLNRAAQRLASHTASQAVGQPFTQVFSVWPELVAHYRKETQTYAEVTLGAGETQRCFDLRISPLYRRNGHLTATGHLVVLNEITEHKQTERALRESEERFRNVFEEAPIGMAVVSLESTLLQVNKAFCEMLGYGEQELAGRSFSAITHHDDIEKGRLLAMQALKGEIGSYKVEKRYLKKNHETLWADLTVTVLRHQDGQAMYGLVMIENIIERKRAKLLEEERHHMAYDLHDGLAQVAASVHQHWTTSDWQRRCACKLRRCVATAGRSPTMRRWGQSACRQRSKRLFSGLRRRRSPMCVSTHARPRHAWCSSARGRGSTWRWKIVDVASSHLQYSTSPVLANTLGCVKCMSESSWLVGILWFPANPALVRW